MKWSKTTTRVQERQVLLCILPLVIYSAKEDLSLRFQLCSDTGTQSRKYHRQNIQRMREKGIK